MIALRWVQGAEIAVQLLQELANRRGSRVINLNRYGWLSRHERNTPFPVAAETSSRAIFPRSGAGRRGRTPRNLSLGARSVSEGCPTLAYASGSDAKVLSGNSKGFYPECPP